ncbi:MAG TPA: SDR family NAD(P)-dependent oxidoreductase [Aquificaceae bacterium]|nr:SDR family NAD(P)-dependent oxidoreductase [Aquificaceae bacterium]
MKLLITGIGSGLGRALAEKGLAKGYEVYALGRHLPKEMSGKVRFAWCDLQELESISSRVSKLLEGVRELELVILNAGVLGVFGDVREVPLYEMRKVMDINLWANKVLLDTLVEGGVSVRQVVGISSGAAVNCNRGWNAYSISKAAFNCLLRLYAREMRETHFTALAPGLVLTPMLEEVMKQDEERFPSIKRIKESPKRTPD